MAFSHLKGRLLNGLQSSLISYMILNYQTLPGAYLAQVVLNYLRYFHVIIIA